MTTDDLDDFDSFLESLLPPDVNFFEMSANPLSGSFSDPPSALVEIARLRRLLELGEDVMNGFRTGVDGSMDKADGLWAREYDRAGLREMLALAQGGKEGGQQSVKLIWIDVGFCSVPQVRAEIKSRSYTTLIFDL